MVGNDLFNVPILLESGARILSFHVIDERGVVLADEGLFVVAGDVVPLHAVAVEVVEHGEARLVILARFFELAVVRLRLSPFARVTPFAVQAIRGRCQTHA